MKRLLLIDDIREVEPDPAWDTVIARTPSEGLEQIAKGWDLVLLDHDLGEPGDVRPIAPSWRRVPSAGHPSQSVGSSWCHRTRWGPSGLLPASTRLPSRGEASRPSDLAEAVEPLLAAVWAEPCWSSTCSARGLVAGTISEAPGRRHPRKASLSLGELEVRVT